MLQAIGMVFVALGLIGIIFGIFQKIKAGRVTDAPLVPTGDAASRGRELGGPKGQISAQGNVVCQQPLMAPFSGQPCLYFHIKCTAKWKSGDTHKSQVVDEQKMAAQFAIDDGTGPVWIDAREGGDFSPTQTKSETRGTGLIGGLTGSELVFGQYRVNTPILDIGTKYEVDEEIFPMVPRVYACGRVGDQPGMIVPPTWRQMIMSSHSRDELLASASKLAKIALFAGLGAFVVGSGMAVVGQFVLHGDADADKASAAAASASAMASIAPASSSALLVTPPPMDSADAAPPMPSASASAGHGKGKKKKKGK